MNRRRVIGATPLLLACGWLGAVRADESVWRRLAAGGCAVVLRHAQTVSGIGDPPGYRLDDCATQRNLSDAGRAEARRFGAEFTRRSVRVDEVLSSRWCRCLDTARLAFPRDEVRVFEPLNSFFDDRRTREAQTAALRARLAQLAAPRIVVMVTHMVNIAALTGQSVSMGEALVVRVPNAESVEVLGRLVVA
jgi:phosphohistidine phosphatase SixA